MEEKENYEARYQAWQKYSAIKLLVDEYFILQEGKKHEDFIRKVSMILGV